MTTHARIFQFGDQSCMYNPRCAMTCKVRLCRPARADTVACRMGVILYRSIIVGSGKRVSKFEVAARSTFTTSSTTHRDTQLARESRYMLTGHTSPAAPPPPPRDPQIDITSSVDRNQHPQNITPTSINIFRVPRCALLVSSQRGRLSSPHSLLAAHELH